MPLTKRQREILTYLDGYAGKNGYAPSFEEIAEHFNYNSLATVHEHLSNLEKKGYITHRKQGRAFIFLPVVDKTHARRSALKTLVNRFFEGSPRLLVLNLLEDHQLSADALEQLKHRIKETP